MPSQSQDVIAQLKSFGEVGQPRLRHSCDELFVFVSREFHLFAFLLFRGSIETVLQKLSALDEPVETILSETLGELEQSLKRSNIPTEIDVFAIVPDVGFEDSSRFADLLPLEQTVFMEDVLSFPGCRISPAQPLSDDDFNRLSEVLFPKRAWKRIVLASDAGRLVRHEKRAELDRVQREAASGLDFETTIIEGGPGTGKSLVLVSRAMWLASALPDSRILLVTWNRSLVDALNGWVMKLKSDKSWPYQGKVEALVLLDLFKRHGIAISLSDPADADHRCNDILARKRFEPAYDAILVDEAQDLGGVMIRMVEQFVRPERGGITLSLDASQNIRDRPPIEFDSLRKPFKVIRLVNSYRSTSAIQKFNEVFGKHQSESTQGQQEANQEQVRLVWAENDDECAKMVVWESVRLIRDVGVKPGEIMAVCFTTKNRLRIKELFAENGVATSTPGQDQSTTGILLASPEIAKGHEASCVFLTGWDQDGCLRPTPENECRRYVAGSRATDMLYVVYSSQQIPDEILKTSKAIKQLWPDDFRPE